MKTNPTLRRVIHPEIRVLDAKQGICEYVASDETLDSYGEIILAKGWQFSQFAKNAPFVDSHDYGDISKLLGKVIDFKVSGSQLVETVQWAIDVPENAMAQLGWKMTQGGYLKAVSVGFYPISALSKWDADAKPFSSLCGQLKADPNAVRCIYTKQEQVELSACIIGANPNALAKAMTDGVITADDVIKTFPETEPDKNGDTAHATGRAMSPTLRRSREWFLDELNQAMKSL